MTKYEIIILTKFNSVKKKRKKDFLNKHGIHDIVFVPYTKNKIEFVNPINCYLIDDKVNNLIDWEVKKGISIFFNKNMEYFDNNGDINTKYKIIDNI